MPKLSEQAISVNRGIEERIDIVRERLLENKTVKSIRKFAESIGYLDSNFFKIAIEDRNYTYSLSAIALLCVKYSINANWIMTGNGEENEEFNEVNLLSDTKDIESHIKKRYFEAIDDCIEKGRFSSINNLAVKMGVHRQQLYFIKNKPQKAIQAYMVTFLMENYSLNANWLLIGKGKMYGK